MKGRGAANPDHQDPDVKLSLGGEGMAQLIKCSPHKHEDLSSLPQESRLK